MFLFVPYADLDTAVARAKRTAAWTTPSTVGAKPLERNSANNIRNQNPKLVSLNYAPDAFACGVTANRVLPSAHAARASHHHHHDEGDSLCVCDSGGPFDSCSRMRSPRAIYAPSHARARRLHRIVRISDVRIFVDGLYTVSARSRAATRHHEPE